MKTKKCSLCKQEQPISNFHKHRGMKDGLSLWCKNCVKKRGKEYRETPRGIYTSAKGRNKYYQHKPFKITIEEFIDWYNKQEKQCVYCGIFEEDLSKIKDYYNNKAHRLTIDCIDNDIGYVNGNLVLACLRCNALKSNFLTFDEMRFFAKKYIQPKWEQQLNKKLYQPSKANDVDYKNFRES